eukprot:CAMPEP_0180163408 /NCGR_PEP_ID=MMETSP0986-20121125/29786_1 /TAXON_ID=697907 /ORGANISM="non described non described, Strain CCMP2293" /LENGTH=51 /DNA_ID=CAMNT_0022114047 /DNA_START=281 /DNA_END=433 /DNA_ORIENTATION=+
MISSWSSGFAADGDDTTARRAEILGRRSISSSPATGSLLAVSTPSSKSSSS